MKTPTRLTLLAALALLGLRAEASTITLQPSQSNVQQDASFTVNVLLDAADAPGGHPGLFSGQIIIDFDPALVSYTGFSTALSLFEPVTTGSSGSRQTVSLGFQGAGDNGVVGTFGFKAVKSNSTQLQTATIGIADVNGFFGSFVNTVPTEQAFYPVFTGTSVQIQAVPLPGAAWLAATALGAAATRLRRRGSQRASAAAR